MLALNSIEYLELYHAAYLGGGIINPINIRLAPKKIAFILEDSGTEVLFVDAIFAPAAEAIRDQLPDLRSVVLIGADPEGDVRIDARYDDIVAAGDEVDPPETEESDPACLMYTGGTTGLPKGVVPFTFLTDEHHRAGGDRLRSAGRVIPNVDISIQDPDGNLLAQGEVGEICTRAGHQLHGYWNRPEQNAESFGRGWFRTGDRGYLDPDHYLFLVDRAKDMIISGGENVYTAEVESAISTHDAVADVAVIGIPSEEWGEAVHAVVVVAEGASVTEDEIIAHARESTAGYKVPRSVELRTDPLPLSGAGKTLKRELRAPFWEGHDRSVS